MIRKKKRERKEKPPEPRYIVVRQSNATKAKYLHREGHDGFSLSHAQALAAHVPGQEPFSVIRLDAYLGAQEAGEVVDAQTATNNFANQETDDEQE